MKKDVKKTFLIQELIKEDKKDKIQVEKLDKLLNEPIIEEVKVKKQRLKRVILRNENLINTEKGLFRLYEMSKKFSDQKQKQKSKNQEVSDVDFVGELLFMVKQWGHELMPRYDFQYLLERIQVLGKNHEQLNFMSKLRGHHIGELSEEELKEMFKSEAQKLQSLPQIDLQVPETNPVPQKQQKEKNIPSNSKALFNLIQKPTKIN